MFHRCELSLTLCDLYVYNVHVCVPFLRNTWEFSGSGGSHQVCHHGDFHCVRPACFCQHWPGNLTTWPHLWCRSFVPCLTFLCQISPCSLTLAAGCPTSPVPLESPLPNTKARPLRTSSWRPYLIWAPLWTQWMSWKRCPGILSTMWVCRDAPESEYIFQERTNNAMETDISSTWKYALLLPQQLCFLM